MTNDLAIFEVIRTLQDLGLTGAPLETETTTAAADDADDLSGPYYTDRVSPHGSRIVVVSGTSDWGARGWLVCEEVKAAGYATRRTSLAFHEDFTPAWSQALNGEFYGF